MKFSSIIFDMDGTLMDSHKDIAAALNYARTSYGYDELSTKDVLPMIGNGVVHLVTEGFRGTNISIEEATARVKDYYGQNPCIHTKLYPQVKETLHQLKALHIDLHIVSNKPSELLAGVLKALNIDSYFKMLIGGDDMPKRKPHPMSVDAILAEHPCKREEVLMVGDM
ncbi:MAG: HAD-IA family hydrolase, partial [Planctomycetes bacterium]|nr:HAD-IA family hydrolase [Planctomycetota bacterium]